MTGHVLLSNDDGVMARGLRILCDVFLRARWQVTVSAPETQRSAASHGITISRPMVAKRIGWDGVPNGTPLAVWAVDGTPADCVMLGLLQLCASPPDLVVSGINDGWNVGTDVHYSGTVGAAMEAAFHETRAIAVSTQHPTEDTCRYAAQLAEDCARRLIAMPWAGPAVLNINTPECAPEDIKGVLEAPLTCVKYTDDYDIIERHTDHAAYWLKGNIIKDTCAPEGDLAMLHRGYATLTMIGWDLTQHGACASFLQDK